MIDRLPMDVIMPTWSTQGGTRWLSHPDLRVAMVQLQDEPDWIYVISDEALPPTLERAVAVVIHWRASNGQAA